jgi:acetyl esterase/lipase
MPTEPQTFVYKIADDCEIRADVHLPKGDGPHPVLVWLHGGALIGGGRSMMNPEMAARYRRAGMAVVSVDYRLAPETKLPEIIEDLRDAFAWVRQEGPGLFGADADRVAVMGYSAGGYLTLMAGFCVEPRPIALVSVSGYGDIVGRWYRLPDDFYRQQPLVAADEAYGGVGGLPLSLSYDESRGRFYLYCRQNGCWCQEVCGHDPATEGDWFIPYCPERNVDADYPPTLLIHGDADTDVPYEQSVQMAGALEAAGVPHELITVPRGRHCAVPAPVYDRIAEFLRDKLGL